MADDAVYHHNGIRCEDGTVVALKFIESMRFQTDIEDAVVDKLKGDLPIFFRTISGKEYIVYVNSIIEREKITNFSKEEVRMSIYKKWSTFLKG